MSLPPSPAQITEMSDKQLREAIVASSATADSIECQLTRAHTPDKPADPSWRANANFTRKQHRRAVSLMEQELSRRRREANRGVGRTLAEHFVDVAREELDPDDFREMLATAQQRCL